MPTLVICTPTPSFAEQAAPHLAEEQRVLTALKAEGLLREAWLPDGPGAVLLFEDDVEVETALARLPLVGAGLITTQLTRLTELPLPEEAEGRRALGPEA